MYKTIKLSVPSLVAIGLFITGCSQQPVNQQAVADIQPVAAVAPTAIDHQVQNVVMPKAPKVYPKPQKMVQPVRMAKPIQRQVMAKPIQRHKMMSTMAKPIQRQVNY